MIIENVLKTSAEIPLIFANVARKRVKNVKLRINPVTIPKGFFRLPVIELERMIGSMGRIQGERIVTIPAKKAKKKSTSIVIAY